MALTLPVLQPAGVTLVTMVSTGSHGLSTIAMCIAALALLPARQAGPWGVAVRIAIVTAVSIVAFYYNDLYNFEAPTTSASCSAVSAARSV